MSPIAKPNSRPRPPDVGLPTIATLVLWSGCLAVGLTGIAVRRSPPVPPSAQPPTDALLLNVEAIGARPPADSKPPAPPAAAQTPPPPQPPEIAPPNAPFSFAQPENAPVHVLDPRRPVSPQPATQNSVIQLTYGQGEGEQPAPDYPEEAVIAGQEGTVVIRFTVSQDGRVTDAQAVSPCPWPILNNAALRAIRNTWRFRPGPVRYYEISIEFHLNRHE